MVPYYQYTIAEKFPEQEYRNSLTSPAPNGGNAGVRGAIMYSEKAFLQSNLS
jgi:hypothetical protein